MSTVQRISTIAASFLWQDTIELWEHIPEVILAPHILVVVSCCHHFGILTIRVVRGAWDGQTFISAIVCVLNMIGFYITMQLRSVRKSRTELHPILRGAFHAVAYHFVPLIAVSFTTKVRIYL